VIGTSGRGARFAVQVAASRSRWASVEMRVSDTRALGVLGVVVAVVAATWAGLALHTHLVNSRIEAARGQLTQLHWPTGYRVEPAGAYACQSSADRLCVSTSADPKTAALAAASALGLHPSDLVTIDEPAPAPDGYRAYATLSGVTASVTVFPTMVIHKSGPKPIPAFPESVVSVWLVD
jgi:hypothetical protein